MSEFRFHSVSWERIDGIWPSFAYTLILTTSGLGLLHVNFHKLITRVMASDIRILFPLNILRTNWWNLTKFCICIDMTRSRLGLLHVNFHKFLTLWPLIDVRILFPLRIDGIGPSFAYALIWTTSGLGLLHINFHRVMALDWCLNFLSAQYLGNKLMEFDKILHMHWYFQDLGWNYYASIFTNL